MAILVFDESNRFLAITLILSMVIHGIVFWGFSHVPLFEAHIVQDLTFDAADEPPPRSIPRPRAAAREVQAPDDLKDMINIKPSSRDLAPVPANMKAPPVDSAASAGGPRPSGMGMSTDSDGALHVPTVPGVSAGSYGLHISQWNPSSVGDLTSVTDFSSPQMYFDMVKMRIEKNKIYPESAKSTHAQGSVGLRFTITPEGGIKNPEVTKTSRHAALDQAAIKALQDAAPFPKPPARFFKGDLTLQVSVLFELI